MKILIALLLTLTILVGLGSALTPMIASWLVPISEITVKKAEPQAVADALHQWFQAAPDVRFTETHGLHRSDADGRVSWMSFHVDPATVSRFIHIRGLQQLTLDAAVLDEVFDQGRVPADWWKPVELTRETWFSGQDGGRDIGLIYNAEWQKGYLVAKQSVPR